MSEKSESKLARSFSIELSRGDQIRRVSFPEGSGKGLMIEGLIGEVTEIEIIEDILLEIRATDGVLRIELSRDELKNTLKGKKSR